MSKYANATRIFRYLSLTIIMQKYVLIIEYNFNLKLKLYSTILSVAFFRFLFYHCIILIFVITEKDNCIEALAFCSSQYVSQNICKIHFFPKKHRKMGNIFYNNVHAVIFFSSSALTNNIESRR